MTLPLKKFDMSSIKINIPKRETGRTFLQRDIIYYNKEDTKSCLINNNSDNTNNNNDNINNNNDNNNDNNDNNDNTNNNNDNTDNK